MTKSSFKRVQALNEFVPGLADNPNLITTLDPSQQTAVLADLLCLACQAQNVQNIRTGRQAIWSIEKAWLLAHIEAAAEPFLRIGDEWEYRRLIELYWHIDKGLVQRLVDFGKSQAEDGICQAAAECEAKLARVEMDKGQDPGNLEYEEF
jgi:hypothetical protein